MSKLANLPLISIIMNCYNGERHLKMAIDSVYAQGYSHWEIIFWDNQSTDQSASIAKNYDDRLRYFRAKTHTTLGGARHLALKEARGEYITFLDCDDSFVPDRLQLQVRFMQQSGFLFSYGAAEVIDESGNCLFIQQPRHKSGDILVPLLYHHDINTQSVMIHRQVFENHWCQFNSTFVCCVDYYLYMLIANHYPIGIMPEILSKYRKSNNSLSKRSLHHVSKEVGHTLNTLEMMNSDKICTPEFRRAIQFMKKKLSYYQAVSHVSNAHYSKALKMMRRIWFQRLNYFIFTLMVAFRLPSSIILKALRR